MKPKLFISDTLKWIKSSLSFLEQMKLIWKREDFGWRHLAWGTPGLGGDWSAEVVMVVSCWRLFLAVSAAHYRDGWVNGCSATGSSDALRESSIPCRPPPPQPFSLSFCLSFPLSLRNFQTKSMVDEDIQMYKSSVNVRAFLSGWSLKVLIEQWNDWIYLHSTQLEW